MERNTRIRRSQLKSIAPSDVDANATNTGSAGQVPSKASGSGTDQWTWIDSGGGSATDSYSTSFTNGDLSAGVLTVTHNLGVKYVAVKIYNNEDKEILPDEITLSSTTTLTIDLSSYGTISGTWNVVVINTRTPASGESGGRYANSFTNGDLSSGILTITHSLGVKYIQLYVFDNNDKMIIPDDVTLSSTSACTADFSSYGTLSGTWNYVVLG